MKIALAQINYHIGNFESNTHKIIEKIDNAEKAGANLIVFAELAISGYPPRDFLEFRDFVEQCEKSIDLIARRCVKIAAIIGFPSFNDAEKGKPLFNSAAFLFEGVVKSLTNKTLLPNYDIFDEYRYFEPNNIFKVINFKGNNIALTICEDLWNVQDNPLYNINPMDELIGQNPDIIINIAASPFNYHQTKQRKEVLKRNAVKYNLPLIYVNHVGAQTELLFDGGSLVMSSTGNIVGELNYFKEDFNIFDIDDIKNNAQVTDPNSEHSEIESIYNALVMGVRNYFQKLGFDKAILGLSGGIDSALTSAIAAKALGSDNVYNVLLPSRFSSKHSVDDSIKLADNLKMPYDIIKIEDAVKSFESTLSPFFKDTPFGITEENLQARTRGVILMALSNKFGYILLNTSNKSEAAVGYGTLYGDMNGGLSVIGDVYKTQAYELAKFINRNGEVIPVNIINKPPSAELRPDQKDSDSLPDYEVLDEILFQYIEHRKGPREIIEMGFDKKMVDRILKLVNINEYKRYQTPPTLRISSKAFGMGRRMPIVAKYLDKIN
ncbi:MAG: NAD+ synthase [Lentimicrobiaceae bacterium]|jgi:NAD+ synthase (glutamine-hydrolysing)|nr:NAD+ synthase [Lentimicrobiaceae bacterium]MBT3454682.1 NAD+ synthase [Lentimicrobiaceae bacterium]MBT3819714.1 NAD+ synthase [Lentimicrobiaceae bacterium]MBT4061208.1 NAD+ synthase [Lentimicrobiaceae bacterium]MBT4191367.1 NAD+ synthase [Lentimicrobiaceae bacterium]